jgi:hypothetical protein
MKVPSSKSARLALATAVLAGVFFTLPFRADAQHPFGFAVAEAGQRHDSANPRNNNTDVPGHQNNEYLKNYNYSNNNNNNNNGN